MFEIEKENPMEPIFTRFIPETSSLLLPAEEVRMYGDLPAAEYVYPDAVSKAEALLGQPIPALPASLYRQYYENGNLDLYFEITLPAESGINANGYLFYRPKDCLIPDESFRRTETLWHPCKRSYPAQKECVLSEH